MWLVKKAASKVAKLSQKVMREETQGEKMIKEIISNKNQVMPVKKMSELSSLSYNMDRFDQILQFVKEKLQDLKIEKKSLKKRLNLLVLISYLIKHGASGFIDEFREIKSTFTKYEILAVSDNQEDKDLYPLKLEVSQRANYIKILLTDKSVLAREKELARKIKEKLMTQGGDYTQQNKDQNNGKDEEKVESFLQHYLWRYTSKIDKKLDDVADALIAKIDKYLDGEIPQSFEIDQLEEEITKKNVEDVDSSVKEKSIQEEKKFMKDKVPLEEAKTKSEQQVNLIDLVQKQKQIRLTKVSQAKVEVEKSCSAELKTSINDEKGKQTRDLILEVMK